MKALWLIQRGQFEKNIKRENIKGIDSLINYDYMGSSEFEFGALPKSLKRMIWSEEWYSFFVIEGLKNVLGQNAIVYCKPSEFKEIEKMVYHLSKNKFGYREYCNFADFFIKDSNEYNLRNDFWWDIKNDFMLFFEGENVLKIYDAFEDMKVREVLK